MKNVEKTVFISYRRTNVFTARAIYQNLTHHKYDVFFDYESIDSGDFAQNILQSIESRAHFLLILTPSALERCSQPKDWLRREIEHALKFKRNIIPLIFEGFDFKEMKQHLPKHMAEPLSYYNAMRIPADYFDEAMARLRERYLNVSLDMVLRPQSQQTKAIEAQQKKQANLAPKVTKLELLAEELVEQARSEWNTRNSGRAITLATEALTKYPNYALAYSIRAVAYSEIEDSDAALMDIDAAILLDPDNTRILCDKGIIYDNMKRFDAAIQSYTKAILLDPMYAIAYYNRGLAHGKKGDHDAAIADFDTAILLNPQEAITYTNRGLAHGFKGDHDAAITDFDTAILLNPQDAIAYYSRGLGYHKKGDKKAALTNYEQALKIDPNHESTQKNLEIVKRNLGT